MFDFLFEVNKFITMFKNKTQTLLLCVTSCIVIYLTTSVGGKCNMWRKRFRRLEELNGRELKQAKSFFDLQKCTSVQEITG